MSPFPPWSGAFRLAGFDGSALFLRTAVYPGLDEDTGEPALGLGVDIGLLSVTSCTAYLLREMDEAFASELSEFLRRCGAEWAPESTLAPYEDASSGLACSVLSSDSASVDLLWSMGDPEGSSVRLSMSTSRAAVVQASLDVRLLQPTVEVV